MNNRLKYFKNRLSLFLSFLFLFQLILLTNSTTAFASATPSVSYTLTGDTKIGNTIQIAIDISNVTDLYGGSIDFVYDTSLLEIQSVTKGNIFGSNTVLTPLGTNGKIENGQASFSISLKGDKPGVNGNGTLAIIKAKVLKEGTVKLNTTNSNKPGLSLDGNTVRVKLSNSNVKNIDYTTNNKIIILENIEPVKLNSITTDKVSPQAPGSTIKITADASGGSSLLYQFWVNDGSGWKVVRNYNASNSYEWTPTSEGDYTIAVYVKDINSKNSLDDSSSIKYSIKDVKPVKLNSITTDKVSPQAPSSTIKITADASGGSSLLYQFWVNDGSGWKVVRNYNASNSYEWTPTSEGDYTIAVYVKDINSKNSLDDSSSIKYSIKDVKPVKLDSITTDKVSPQAPGSTIKITADASGGSSLLYQFWVNDGSGWKVVRNYNASNSYEWTPTSEGDYTIAVYVKDINSKNSLDDSSSIKYSVKDVKPVKLDSITTDKVSPQAPGSTIKITADASGGSSLLYQFWVNDGSGWKVVRNYNASNSYEWTPTSEGDYTIAVYVKDINSKNSLDDSSSIKYSIKDVKPVKLNSITTDKVSPQAPSSTIKITADASGGSSLLYQFWVNDGSGWKVVRNYNASNSYEWTPTSEGDYTIAVYVKDINSKNSLDDSSSIKYSIKNLHSRR